VKRNPHYLNAAKNKKFSRVAYLRFPDLPATVLKKKLLNAKNKLFQDMTKGCAVFG
jgi:hypothetical protein